jgi:hypothetical protein
MLNAGACEPPPPPAVEVVLGVEVVVGLVANISLTDLKPIAAVVAMFASFNAKPKGVVVLVANSAVIP